MLTKAQHKITISKRTETPGTCLFEQIHEGGTFRCVRCGTALFNSSTEFKSETG